MLIVLIWSVLSTCQSVARQPLSIKISAKPSTVRAGSSVMIDLYVTNLSRTDLDTGASISELTGIDPNYVYGVRDSAGHGVAKRLYRHPELALGHAILGTLKPGESVTLHQEISRLFDLTHPGKYSVQVSRRFPWNHKDILVRSNKIVLTITP